MNPAPLNVNTIMVHLKKTCKPKSSFKAKWFAIALACYRRPSANAPAAKSYENIGMEGKVRDSNPEEQGKGIKVQVNERATIYS